MTTLVETAILYREKYKFSVIPIDMSDPKKKPLVDWAQYQTRRASDLEIRTWWSVWPEAGIGVVTGRISGIIVVDIDPRHGGQWEPIHKAAPTRVVVATPSGGRHMYYAYSEIEERIPNRVGIVEGVDIRADGGYVVAPPSRNVEGKVYSWLVSDCLGKLPSDMLRSIIHGSERTKVPTGDKPKWFVELWQFGAPEGKRNDSATRISGYLASKGLPPDIVLSMVSDWNSDKNSVPLTSRDIETIVKSVFRTKGRKDDGKFDGKDSMEEGRIFSLVPFTEYVETYGGSQVNWLVDGWLPDQTIAFMVAAPESYKTWLLVDLAVSVSSGTPFLGKYAVSEPGPVIVIQQEDHHGDMAERMSVVVSGKDLAFINEDSGVFTIKVPPELPIYMHPDGALKFQDDAIMGQLEDHIRTIRPKLVLIDPLYAAANMEDYMAKAVKDMMKLKQWRNKYGTAFVIAHHTKKQDPKRAVTTARDDIWGSQYLNAFLETGWQIRQTEERGRIVVRRHFKSAPGSEEITLKFDINTETMPFHYKVEEGDPKLAAPTEMDEVLDLLMTKGKLSVSKIAEALGKGKGQIQRRLDMLVEDGLVIKDPTDLGYYAKLELVDVNSAK